MGIRGIWFTIAGSFLLLLGVIGAFIPLLPTTPLVLAAAGRSASAPRLRTFIMRIPFSRAHIENYRERRGLSRETVVASLALLWAMMALSAAFSKKLWITLLLLGVGGAVTAHILTIARPGKKHRKAGKTDDE